jgi:hypothetical protein
VFEHTLIFHSQVMGLIVEQSFRRWPSYLDINVYAGAIGNEARWYPFYSSTELIFCHT